MATLIFPTFVKFLILSCFILLILAEKSHAGQDFHTIHVNSLFQNQSSVCKPFTGTRNGSSTLEVTHWYGPCSALNQEKATAEPTLREILSNDEYRVRSIQVLLGHRGKASVDTKTELTGQYLTGHFVVRIGLGTPKQSLSLSFDTGSTLTWTQCQPCAGSCYQQQDPIFNPSSSSSYANISCGSLQCSQLAPYSGKGQCFGPTCAYNIHYMDKSFTQGYFAQETLTLTPTDVFQTFQFGCGQNNKGLFGNSAGILGLGRDPQSLISQTAQKYNNYFSYCFPSSSSSTGHLTLGKGSSENVLFTPLLTSPGSPFYFIDIIGISVGGYQLPIDQSVFKNSGNIIDSGTTITRLHPLAYSAMRSAFQEMMRNYPRAPAISIFDTCYDFSSFSGVITIPSVSFIFAGNLEVHFDYGILFPVGANTACLAFAPNADAAEVGILGNYQQTTFEVVYDVAGEKLGFAAGGCK